MSLWRQRLGEIALRRRRESLRDDQSGYENEAQIIRASIQPLRGMMAAQMYGQRLSQTKILLIREGRTQPRVEIAGGMGVCVDVPWDCHPDYLVVYTAHYATHTLAHIQFIPQSERSDG